ncbi:type I-C CRISPR-associated protein Cas8c/Csd1 [Halobacillus amylolyticus]|uniref:Type I-C CRISPR-associated protein Cas8c/Csd1 n=1 Tax=Halobacillus amylolyticus TaxID=2932259 RepID=A0ABY4HF78_9BACI|nr:type I-C CRISPR-associated protein Cas8c/Csd1 [Halobacillus amylolyticus]UOR13570.1 type I-C CRISPR-associated protein Cas8c/Csd1 [Halobacillus amylolyticus]
MGWLFDLYQTYENNKDKIGKVEKRRNGQEYTLLPTAHTTQNAQVEVIIDERGDFYSAKVIDKNDAITVIPCTESSFSRTSKPVPHPLHDKLMYVAGDFTKFGGKIKEGNTPYEDYLAQLREWSESSFANDKVKKIYQYVKKGTLIEDLVASSNLFIDKHHQLIPKWSKKVAEEYGEKPELFKVMSDSQDKIFIRFDTHKRGSLNTKVWKDEDVYHSFISFYKDKLQADDICYVTGENRPKTERHSSNIRRGGDNAKLISANDTAGYTYRGRFVKAGDVASISYDVSQKSHNALKWLISKQGKSLDGKVFLVWGSDEVSVPSPQDDLLSLMGEVENRESSGGGAGDDTHEVFAEEFNRSLAGYKSDLAYHSSVNILILDAATPGRLSVMYYRNIDKEEYLQRIEHWHKTCQWLHRYRKDVDFHGAPATKDIAKAAYGPRASDKLVKGVMERMLPCIVEGQRIPRDIIRSAFYRVSNPVSMEKWEWEKTLSITCALLKKHYEKKEDYHVSLDVTNTNRDYLFGRLLAIADVLERRALTTDDNRASNAIRYMNAFAKHPTRTWSIIQANLQPYQAKLGNKTLYYNRLIDEVASQIEIDDFNNKPLSGVYLLGFYSQRHELYKNKKEKQNEAVEINE